MVFNDGEGSWSRAGVSARLRELWRVGGLEDDEALADPQIPAVSSDGWVAIPDAILSEVILVSPGGEWRGSVLREGEGPGEVRWPVAAGWRAEGILLVLDLSVGKVIEFDASRDSLLGEWKIPEAVFTKIGMSGFLPAILLTSSGTAVLEMPWIPVEGGSPRDRHAVLLEVGPSYATPETLLATRIKMLGRERFTHLPLPGAARPLMAAGPSGSLALAGEDARYRIRLLDSTRRDSLVICRNVAPLPLSPSERGEAEQLGDWREEFAQELEAAPRPDSLMPFGRMVVGAGGRLWVQRERRDALGYGARTGAATYDVFEAGGEYLGVVRGPDGIRIVGEADGLVFGYETGELDEVSLVAYRLELGSDSED